jgi:hypothetical protein
MSRSTTITWTLALWNGKDPILKERAYGLTSTPTHSYMKYLYKYPQTAFPYVDLIKTNHGRSRREQRANAPGRG